MNRIARSSLRGIIRQPMGVARCIRFRSSIPQPYSGEFADYPKTKAQEAYFKNPYLQYDDKQGCRNFGETVHPFNDMYDIWSPDRYDIVDNRTAVKYIFMAAAAIGGFIGLIYFTVGHESPAVRRSYPQEGLYKALGGTEETKEVYGARVDRGD